jgi:hypothetical protein
MSNETLSIKKTNQSGSGSTVTVASKLPMPMILALHTRVRKTEPIAGGGIREFDAYEKRFDAPEFIVAGNSHPQNQGPKAQIVGGFALTSGIPKDFWDEWCEQNKGHVALKNSMLFAHSEIASVTSKATDLQNERSGMERINPDNTKQYGVEKAERGAA